MNIEKSGFDWPIGLFLRGLIGFAAGVLIVFGIDITYGSPDRLLTVGAIAAVGGLGSGLVSIPALLLGPEGCEYEDVVDIATVIAAASQFCTFLVAGTVSLIHDPSVTSRLVVIITAIILAVIMAVIGGVAGMCGSLFAVIVPETISAKVSLFTNPSQSLSDDEHLPRVLVAGAIARLPVLLYLPIALLILGWEWVFKAVGRTPPVNEYLIMRAETPEIVGTQVREDLPEVSEYTVALDFANYQQALEFLEPLMTAFLLPDSIVGLIIGLLGSTILTTIQAIIYYILYLISIVGILELLLPLVIILSVLGMIPSYKTGIPIWVFIGNIVAVGVVGFTLILFGPIPLIGVGLTYQLGILGKLHLLAILTHAVTGFVALHEYTEG